MEPNKSPAKRRAGDATEIDFLPDADAIERNPLPRYVRLTLHVMAFAFFSFIVWASFSKVEKVVVAHGRLVNPQPNIVVSPLDTAIVKTIAVRPGQVVNEFDEFGPLPTNLGVAPVVRVIKSRTSSIPGAGRIDMLPTFYHTITESQRPA